MLYQAYQTHSDALEPMRWAAYAAAGMLEPGTLNLPWQRSLSALFQVSAFAALTHKRRPFAIRDVTVGRCVVPVREEAVLRTPFCTLVRFRKETGTPQPPVLLVAPISGHFATLLRDTVQAMVADHDVYITDWHNARDVPLAAGVFGFDDFVDHVIQFLTFLGPDAHLVAICQPCVGALAAVAVMAEDGHPAQPKSMCLMAGPIDTRINPTKVDEFALSRPIGWFERHLIGVVPQGCAGALRRVYPGFVQLCAFMAMNLERHMKSFQDLYNHLARGERDKAATIVEFYREYFAVMDLAADFYLETVQRIFHDHELPRKELRWRGRKVDCGAIRKTHLLTVEGDRDDICAVGQTLAAQDLCERLRPYMKRHYVQPGAGHYGVFAGRRWQTQVYPVVRDVIHAAA
ncbi:MAG TPA: polyhydroxyalkanoate depolymerase [Stellaceae bacterium]|nr:polyhydroxyalkanoate depolymerase [Stellaceae bacterium]